MTASDHPHDDSPDTVQAFHRLAASDAGPEHDVLCEELIDAWLPMAHRIARRFRNKGENAEDLQQVAAIGLLKAVNRYDPEQGAFEPYAVPTIRGELRRHFRDYTWDVRVPRRVQDLRSQVRAARRRLQERPGTSGEPGIEELAAETGLSAEEVRDGMEALDSYSALSLDAQTTTGENGYSLADTLGHTEGGFALAEDREAAKESLKALPERERTVLYLRFFEDMTQQRIADQLGMSQMHVSRLITRTCAAVRDQALDPAA
ncbi:SigB/SigF/SigG family RNA polymerase sigma factor [Streptomyces sp. NPDC056910]|uniref:SigB/SigF/SigG family RNA polymerase sigma factor n=1 Tax=Streptomyces sp. NPDC056910 TaxID=3345964 RepID=UPI0036CD31FE